MTTSKCDQILLLLHEKGVAKTNAYKYTQQAFEILKSSVNKLALNLSAQVKSTDEIEISSRTKNDFETELSIIEDKLIFIMHTNVFTLPKTHIESKSAYIKKDINRSQCGMISIYNFLTDSFKYNRYSDGGHLIARIFINNEGHFFAEGNDIHIAYRKFSKDAISANSIANIIETLALYCINFDLEVPPFKINEQITVGEIMDATASQGLSTGKRLGFKFSSSNDENLMI
jgi:hypothetical protein